jgi:hypothetical protein
VFPTWWRGIMRNTKFGNMLRPSTNIYSKRGPNLGRKTRV